MVLGLQKRYGIEIGVSLNKLGAHVYAHGQRTGTYGIFYEYPHPVPGILESEENLPLPQLCWPTWPCISTPEFQAKSRASAIR